jgi:hypothetical protein
MLDYSAIDYAVSIVIFLLGMYSGYLLGTEIKDEE